MEVGKNDLIANLKNPNRSCWRDKVEAVDEIERLREALREYLNAQCRMLGRWAEGDDAVKRELWQNLHACEEAARAALGESDESDTVDESLADA